VAFLLQYLIFLLFHCIRSSRTVTQVIHALKRATLWMCHCVTLDIHCTSCSITFTSWYYWKTDTFSRKYVLPAETSSRHLYLRIVSGKWSDIRNNTLNLIENTWKYPLVLDDTEEKHYNWNIYSEVGKCHRESACNINWTNSAFMCKERCKIYLKILGMYQIFY